MKKSKNLILLLILGIATATASLQAQEATNSRGGNPEKRAEMQTSRMKQELGLSDEQAAKVLDINLKYASKMAELREAHRNGDRTAMREAIPGLRQQQDEELKSVLTAEQFEKLQQLQGPGPVGRPGDGPPNGN